MAPSPSLGQGVPLTIDPDEGDLKAQVADRSMAGLAQSLVIAQAGGDPYTGSFSGLMAGLKEAFRLMTEGFQQACLDVEVVVRKTVEDVTAHNRALTAKAAQDLDLQTSALHPIFDSDGVSKADMMAQITYAWKTRQMVSNRILGHS